MKTLTEPNGVQVSISTRILFKRKQHMKRIMNVDDAMIAYMVIVRLTFVFTFCITISMRYWTAIQCIIKDSSLILAKPNCKKDYKCLKPLKFHSESISNFQISTIFPNFYTILYKFPKSSMTFLGWRNPCVNFFLTLSISCIVLLLYSVQHWRSIATCAAALRLPMNVLTTM